MSQQIIYELEKALGETVALLSSFNEKDINTVPFKDSWTAAQVGRHLFKAEDGIDTLLFASTKPVERPPDANAESLKNILLDFDKKLESPDFLIPENKQYDKKQLLVSLKEAKQKIIPAIQANDLTNSAPLPEGHPLAGSTKLEILHFLVYHTMRHNHQIRKIKEAVN